MLQITRQEQQQKLALTRSMQLSIQVLQMSSHQLKLYVDKELLENPFLDLDASSTKSDGSGRISSSTDNTLESYTSVVSFSQYLVEQLFDLGLSPQQRDLAEKLVFCLDDSGFLGDINSDLGDNVLASVEHIHDIMPLLQTLEPVGVFATNLTNCLALQLHSRGLFTERYEALLQHMQPLANGEREEVCAICGISDVELSGMLATISELNFQPSLDFDNHDKIKLTIPELLLISDANEEVRAELNPEALPKLLLDDALFSTVNKLQASAVDSRYYLDCYSRAAWLITALQKRANTMLAIGQELALLQRRFILSGNLSDRDPLQMQSIASRLGFNKSTISRALANCSIKTDRGVFDTKVFFVRKANPQLENTTVAVLLDEIQRIISAESNTTVYSDQDICGLLAEKGFCVSRRSVSNYRKLLKIPSSMIRKKNLKNPHSIRQSVAFYY